MPKTSWSDYDKNNLLTIADVLLDVANLKIDVDEDLYESLQVRWSDSGHKLNFKGTKSGLLRLLEQHKIKIEISSGLRGTKKQKEDRLQNFFQVLKEFDFCKIKEPKGAWWEFYLDFAGVKGEKTSLLIFLAQAWDEKNPKNDKKPEFTLDWQVICQQALINKPLQTVATEEGFELDIFVPLGLMERKQQQRRPIDQQIEREQVYEVEEKAEITRRFQHEEFLNYIGLGSSQGESDKNIAIIGEPGAGKTTLLQNLAQIISDQQQSLPICVSLGALSKERSLINYLEEKWLQDALAVGEVKESEKTEFRQLFAKRQVWLILDGLDERSADSPVEALTWIEHEVRSAYLQKARVVVSCRVNVWDANIKPLREFVTYKTLDFADPQRDRFIEQWFGKKGDIGLGEQLIACLQETGRERIRELVKNPLRLVLLCQIWSLGEGELPETKAQLYQRYLTYFYQWKIEVRDLTQDDDLQNSLHQALGKLAIASLESISRYRLPRKLASEVMGQEFFKLAVALGWLNIVDRDEATEKPVYAFFHPTFQEFFAACGVEDWDFFLPRNHCDRPVEGKVYRIFETKWKEVILLWLGRGDVKDEEKEAFIKGLVEFKDGCRDFYSGRAYFLSAVLINQFEVYSLGNEIAKNIIGWSFGYLQLEKERRIYLIPDIQNTAREILPEIDRKNTINALIHIISTFENIITCDEAVEILEKIGKGNKEAITNLIKLIHTSDNKYTRSLAAKSLGKIDPGNKEAMTTFSQLINVDESPATRWFAAKSLGEIAPGNQKAINVLIDLIRTSEDVRIQNQSISSLGDIGKGNKEAITLLIQLITTSKDEDARHLAVKSLGKIGQENPEVITFLINLIDTNNNESTSFLTFAVEILGEVVQNNQEVSATLIELIGIFENKYIRLKAIEILVKIDDPINLNLVPTLIELIDTSDDKYDRLKAAEILGKIDPINPHIIPIGLWTKRK